MTRLPQLDGALLARLRLRRCRRVGAAPEVHGRVWVHGQGSVRLGDRVRIEGGLAPVELHAGPGAEIVIGDDVYLGPGTIIEARESITLGAGCRVEGFARVLDNHLHTLRGDRHEAPDSYPVRIGAGARLGWRAVVLPGAQIRDGVEVRPASVVRGPAAPGGAGRGG